MSVPEPPELQQGHSDELAATLAAHPFTSGFDAAHVEVLTELAATVEHDPDEFVLRHGRTAQTLYLLTEGDVALEVAVPGQPPVILETLHAGDVLGWSWLWPPYEWHLDAHARTRVTAVAIDGLQLRTVLAEDPVMGCVIAMRIGEVLVDRLRHARDQLASAVTT